MKRHLSYTSSFIMGGQACRRSMRSWKSSHFCAAPSSSKKRAYLFSSFSTSSVWTWAEVWRERQISLRQGSKKGPLWGYWMENIPRSLSTEHKLVEWCVQESYHRLHSNPATSAMSRMIVMINGRIRHWEVGFRWSIILTTSARLYPTKAQQKQESSFQWFQMTCALNCDGKTWQPNDRSWVCGRGIPAKNRTRMHCKTHTCLI